MKLPPKTGTVCRLSGNRRKPWVAKKFVGYKVDDEKKTARCIYKSIGTFAKKSDAIRALMKAEEKPDTTITLEDVYNEWSEKKYDGLSASSVNNYMNAWRRLEPLHRMPITELKTSDYELTVERSDTPRTVRKNVQLLLNALYQYAIAHDYTIRDISELTDFRQDTHPQIVRKVFTPDEVKALKESDNLRDQIILVGCYTGMRPNELLSLKLSEVDLESGFFRIHGSKTKSGLFRDIPIHPDILPLIKRKCEESAKMKATSVFLSQWGRAYGMTRYADRVAEWNHTPHDTRHSFVTYARRSGMDQLAVKRIVGHSTSRDVTEDIYTHTDDDFLMREMMKYRVE